MNLRRLFNDTRGTTAVEFGITAPAFVLLIIGAIECGLMLWTQLGLQQGVEMGARCASVNKILCGSTSAIQNYAVLQTYGVNPPASTFIVTSPPPLCGNRVSASYTFPVVSNYFGAVTLTANSCFPS
jgi:Flp pilus assembly protein TadG